MRHASLTLGALLFLACDPAAGDDAGPNGRDAGPRSDAGPPADAGPQPDAGPQRDAGPGEDGGPPRTECDYRSVDGVVVIEAENLTLSEDWQVASNDAGFTGSGYIEWTGDSFNNDPSHGPISVAIRLEEAGTYRLQWHTRVGMGSNPTEHNDTWVRFNDFDEFYGTAGPDDAEDRVYPRPLCEDPDFLDGVRAMSNVADASCPNGSSRDGFFKVYSSGALDWRWSARTSDNDAHDVLITVGAPRVVTMELAARADFSQIDRIVLHERSLADSDVRDLANAETPCN